MIDIYFPAGWALSYEKLVYFMERHPLYCAFGRAFELRIPDEPNKIRVLWRCVITAAEIPTNDELGAAHSTNN